MKKILVSLIIGLIALSSFAQSSISVRTQNLVSMGEHFNVTFVIEGENSPSDFQWEPGNDFQLVWGPQRSTSSTTSIINGKRTSSSQITYTYVLMPKSVGRFELPEASAKVKGDVIKSQRTNVEVVEGQVEGNTQQESRSELFLQLTLDRTNVVVGEPIKAELKLYSRVNISGFDNIKFPSFNGFWSQEVEAPTNIQFQRENVDGSIYDAALLRSWMIIPQQAGDLTIEPSEIICLVNQRVTSSTGSIFDSFFQDDFRTIRERVSTKAITVKVAALPSGAPASYGGGVGRFSIKAELSADSLSVHDAASLKITLSGTGNVSLLEAPKVSFPPDFEVYDVKQSYNTSKVFEYPFIPRSHGDFVIPAIEYTYYDVSSRKYVTLKTEDIAINIKPSKSGGTSSSLQNQTLNTIVRKNVKNLGSDIHFILTSGQNFKPKSSFYLYSTGFWFVLASLLILSLAAYFAFKSVAARRADVVGNKNRKASKMARKRLALAGEYLQKNLYTAFYEELHRALLGFVSDKFNMDFSEMSKDNIAENLNTDFTDLLEACEYARYSPDNSYEGMQKHYEKAIEVISSIDGNMKNKKTNSAASKTLISLIALILLSPAMANAQTAELDSLWQAGIEAYSQADFQSALEYWSDIYETGVESDDLYYNIGNAYFKLEDYSHAILNYERTLRLNRSHKDAAHNLEYANEFIQDDIEQVPEFFLVSWIKNLCWTLSSNTWTVLFFVLLAMALCLFLCFMLSADSKIRKSGFILGLVTILFSISSLFMAQWQWADYRDRDEAIITRAVTSVKSSPASSGSTDLFILHEGTKVRILDSVGEWNNIEVSDGRQGWLQNTDMEQI